MSVGAVNKQTGERIPTAGIPAIDSVLSGTSTNPVQNRVVKAALDDKQDAYETITYAEWQAMTPEQQAAKDYYISDYPASAITAGNIAYDNTSSGMSANKVQGAIDELKSGLTNVIKVFEGTMTTNTNGWVVFPDGITILSATIGDYQSLMVTQFYNRGWHTIGRYVFNSYNAPYTINKLTADTEYTVRYLYI